MIGRVPQQGYGSASRPIMGPGARFTLQEIAAKGLAMDLVHKNIYQPQLITNALERFSARKLLELPDGVSLTGREISEQISRFIKALEQCGIRKGSRVGLLSGNRAEVLHVSNAALFAEILLVALHPMGTANDFAYVIEDSSLDCIIFDPKFDPVILGVQQRCPELKILLALGKSNLGIDLIAVAADQAPEPLMPPDLTGDEVFRLGYSGGTTGAPKAIQATHKTALAVTVIQMAEWEWPNEIRLLLCAPLSHAGAATFLPALLRGGTLFVQSGFEPTEVLKAIEKHRITCVLLVPTMIYALLDNPRFNEFDLSSLEVIYYGASPMSVPRLKEGIAKLGKVFFQFYGQAEAPMSITVMRRDEHDLHDDRRLASCGRPVPWVDVALLDAAGQMVPDGQAGEICVRGPLVMPGYLNRPELNAQVFANGWLHTGDVAVRDPDGFLRIVDRSKDMIITGGFNVFPREVEDALGSHPAVASCGVFGVPDAYWGELVTAAVVLKRDADVTPEELSTHVRNLKGPHQAPKRVVFVESLPLTPVGKPDKKALRQRFR